MTDVDQLCSIHIPRWLETPGMAADKISAFYDDPVKIAADENGMKLQHLFQGDHHRAQNWNGASAACATTPRVS